MESVSAIPRPLILCSRLFSSGSLSGRGGASQEIQNAPSPPATWKADDDDPSQSGQLAGRGREARIAHLVDQEPYGVVDLFLCRCALGRIEQATRVIPRCGARQTKTPLGC